MNFFKVDKKRLVMVIAAVITMGFCLSFLNKCNFGTDPCTVFNLGVSGRLGISLGNWQAGLNSVLLIFIFFTGRSMIGWGTLANMFLVGYSFDFFTWINSKWMPENMFDSMTVRIIIAIPALAVFIFVAAIYMSCDLGTAPYDAIPFILSKRTDRISFKTIRMCYDMVFVMGGFLLGSTIGVVTIIMAFSLGPVIAWVRSNVIEKYLI